MAVLQIIFSGWPRWTMLLVHITFLKIQTVLVNFSTWAYNYKTKRTLNRKKQRCYIYLHIPYDRPSYSNRRLRKIKVKYIVLCLNAFSILQNACFTSHYIYIGPVNPLNGLLSVFSRWYNCKAGDSVAVREIQ